MTPVDTYLSPLSEASHELPISPPATENSDVAGHEVKTLVVGLIAGLAYCSWPIGFLVNPTIAATALASELEANGQPFNWLFILLDCVAALATLAVLRLQWPTRSGPRERLLRTALLGYAVFGVATAIDSLIPVGCGSSPLTTCGANLKNFNWDDCLTGAAVLALFVAVTCVQCWSLTKLARRRPLLLALVITVIWSTCGLAYFAVHFSSHPAVPLQHLLLTLTSTVAVTIPVVIALTRRGIRNQYRHMQFESAEQRRALTDRP